MNAAALLREQAARREQEAAELRALAAALDGEAAPHYAPASREDLIDTAAAAVLTRRSSSWLYATARKHPDIGWKVASGSWVWSRPALRAFMAGSASKCEESELCEVCEVPRIP